MSTAKDKLISVWRLYVMTSVSAGMTGVALTCFALGKDADWGHWNLRRYWSGAILTGCGIRHHAVGTEKLDPRRTYIFVSNHYSEWDWYLFTHHIPINWRAVIRADLRNFPLTGPMAARTGQIFLPPKAGAEELVNLCKPHLAQGRSILMYPEGKRPPQGKLAAFRPGAFLLATATETPVVPVAIIEVPPAEGRGPWGRGFAHTPDQVILRVGEPIDPAGLTAEDLGAQAHASMKALFETGPA